MNNENDVFAKKKKYIFPHKFKPFEFLKLFIVIALNFILKTILLIKKKNMVLSNKSKERILNEKIYFSFQNLNH